MTAAPLSPLAKGAHASSLSEVILFRCTFFSILGATFDFLTKFECPTFIWEHHASPPSPIHVAMQGVKKYGRGILI